MLGLARAKDRFKLVFLVVLVFHDFVQCFSDSPSGNTFVVSSHVAHVREVFVAFRSRPRLSLSSSLLSLFEYRSWHGRRMKSALRLPLFLLFNLENFKVFLVVRPHPVSLFELSIRADLTTVFFVFELVLTAALFELLNVGWLDDLLILSDHLLSER